VSKRLFQKKLTRIHLLTTIGAVLLLTFAIGAVTYSIGWNSFQQRLQEIETRHVESRMELNRNAIQQTAAFIRYKKEQSYQELHKQINALLDRLTEHYRNKSTSFPLEELAVLAKNSRISGASLQIVHSRELENLLPQQGFQNFSRSIGENRHLLFRVETALFETSLKKDILETIRFIRFGKENSGYIFVMEVENLQGGPRYAKEILLPVSPEGEGKYLDDSQLDSQGRPYRKEYLRQIRENGDATVRYSYIKKEGGEEVEKISYLLYLPEWQWIVGTGTYLDEMNAYIASEREQFARQIRRSVGITLIIVAVIILASIMWWLVFYLRNRK